MKKVFLICICLSASLTALHAQITLTVAEMPDIGDTIRYSEATPVSMVGYNFTATGVNHTWNFSNLSHAGQTVDTFVAVLSTPIFYYPVFLGNATIAKKEESVNMASFSLTNVYDFFKETPTDFTRVGFAAQLNGLPLPTLYTSPDSIYRFPLNYGNTDSCEFGFSISVPTLFSYDNESKRVNMADGWGTLTTPFGTFQTLRVKSVITSRDSIASDSLPFPIPPTITTTTEYKWLANGYRSPLLVATTRDLGGTTVIYMDHYHSVTGIRNHPDSFKPGSEATLKPFPNPTSGSFGVELNVAEPGLPVVYSLKDRTGKLVQTGTLMIDSGKLRMDISGLQPGVYYLQLQQQDGFSGTAKVVRL